MKKIDVFLNIGAAPSSLELVENPPSGVTYRTNLNRQDTIKYYRKFAVMKRRVSQKILNFISLPRCTYMNTDADLIHSTRGIIILNEKPWVLDIEHAASFVGLQHPALKNKMTLNFIRRKLRSVYCKKLIPHCYASEKSIKHSIGTEGIKDKIETVHLAERPYKGKIKKTDKDKIRLLFIGVGKSFFIKGGKETLEAFSILKKKYDIELLMKSNVPEVFKKKYTGVTYIEKSFSREDLFKNTYAKSDIFVFPSFQETYGIVLMEAMSVGLPIVTTNIFAVPEIVEDWKGGLLVDSQLRWDDEETGLFKWKSWNEFVLRCEMDHPKNVEQIVEKTSTLIEDSSLRKKMGKFNRNKIEKGELSIGRRNERLRRIYEEALGY